MKTQIEYISPAYASMLLKNNGLNRRPSLHRIRMYARDMLNGQWQLTHQGILIGKDGVVIDGQHRLMAIIESGVTIKMQISFSDDIDSPKNCILDQGMSRSVGFIIGKDSSLIGIANLAIELHGINGRTSNSSVNEKRNVVSSIESYYIALMNGSKSSAKNITTSPVMLGACVNIALNNADYVIDQFQAMRTANFKELSPLASSFYRQVAIDQTKVSRPELFARAYRAFDDKKQNLTKLQVKSSEFAIEEAINALRIVVFKDAR